MLICKQTRRCFMSLQYQLANFNHPVLLIMAHNPKSSPITLSCFGYQNTRPALSPTVRGCHLVLVPIAQPRHQGWMSALYVEWIRDSGRDAHLFFVPNTSAPRLSVRSIADHYRGCLNGILTRKSTFEMIRSYYSVDQIKVHCCVRPEVVCKATMCELH